MNIPAVGVACVKALWGKGAGPTGMDTEDCLSRAIFSGRPG